ncbi:MAG: hypothetical protein ABJA66_13245 [Actinomycetota bacterium]
MRENTNAFFKQNFGNNFVSIDITDGHCSCSIYPILLTSEAEIETEELIDKYRKKGWSENKIHRAIDDKKKSENKDVINLREILAHLFEQVGSFWLFAHQYKSLVENEPLKSMNPKDLRVSELLDNKNEVPEDVIVKIKK